MVKGGIFKCFGPAQVIKNKFGVGFEVEIKLELPKQTLIMQELMKELGSCIHVTKEKGRQVKKINFARALNQLVRSGMQTLLADKIRRELVITYKQSNDNVNIS